MSDDQPPQKKPRSPHLKPAWKPGQSGNPKGRPVGSRNKATILCQELLDGEGEAITRKCVELALAGDTTALRLALERLVPPAKERAVTLPLPEINSPADTPPAALAIIEKAASGEITPGEATQFMALLNGYQKAAEIADIENRLKALEAVHGDKR